jgi:molybdopterin-guanine dinucleotide biosynthesis protein A
VDGVTAFIVAGGKSSRMGADKAFLQLGCQTLLARALDAASAVAAEVRIVGDAEKFLEFGRVVQDVFPERGPLGGIHAALCESQTELNLMLAVDLPFLESRFLSYLIASAWQCAAIVTVPRVGSNWQPLCAVYRREFAAVAEKALRKGKNRIDTLFSQVETRAIGDEELGRMGFSSRMFRNLNTPADWRMARAEFEASQERKGEKPQ